MIQTIKQLYFRYKELINYVIVGGLTTVVSLASYYFFTTAFLDPQDPFQPVSYTHLDVYKRQVKLMSERLGAPAPA